MIASRPLRSLLLPLTVLILSAGPALPQDAELVKEGVALFSKGQYGKAEPLFRRALAVREATHGQNSLELCPVLDELGTTYVWLKRYDQAEVALLRSLRLREARYGRDHLYVGYSCTRLTALYKELGQYDRSIEYGERAVKIMETQEAKPIELANALNRLAEAHSANKGYAKAEALYLRELKIHQEIERPRDQAICYQNLGRNYLGMRAYDKAEESYKRSLKLWETIGCHH